MPGIAGVIGLRSAAVAEDTVAAMLESMHHEQYYVGDTVAAGQCDAYYGWLAHPDSYASQMSRVAADGLSLAMAGECFASVDSGTRRGGSPDPLDEYRAHGSDVVARLNGLFSGVLSDPRRHVTWLFNDRYGAEHLYYHIADDVLYFASEAKALLTVLPQLRAFDEDGVAQFLAYGSTYAEKTLFRGISLMPGGSLWVWERGTGLRRGRYFDVREWEEQGELTETAFEEEFVETARAVLPMYAESSQRVGISITGGLDTRMLMACLPQGAKPICHTYAALSGETLDVSVGRRVAHSLGLEHHTLRISKEFVTNLASHIDRTIFLTDGGHSVLGAHEVFLSDLARELAPIRLTGNFGSEILRSMSTLKRQKLAQRGVVDAAFVPRVEQWAAAQRSSHPLTRTAFEEVPIHLFGPMAVTRSKMTFRTPYLDNALVRLAYRAPFASRNSPASALRLIETGPAVLGRIPTDRGYSCGRTSPLYPFRRLYCEVTFKLDYYDKEGLPKKLAFLDRFRGLFDSFGLLGLHKFLPYRHWFRDELAPYVADVLDSAMTREQPWWNRNLLPTLAREHGKDGNNFVPEINAILTLEAVERTLIRDLPDRSVQIAPAVVASGE